MILIEEVNGLQENEEEFELSTTRRSQKLVNNLFMLDTSIFTE